MSDGGSILSGALSIGLAVASGGASLLVQGAMIAGGALQVIGGITGNKNLSKIGGLISLAGGVAGAYTSIASSAAAASAEGAALAADDVALATSGVVDEAATATTAAAAADTAETASMVSRLGPGAEQTFTLGEVAGAPDLATSFNATSFDPTAATVGTETFGGYTASQSAARSAALTEALGPMPASSTGYESLGTGTADMAGISAPTEGFIASAQPQVSSLARAEVPWWQQAGGFIKDNKEIAQIGAGFIQGAFNNTAADARLQQQYKAQREMEDRRRAQYNASVTNGLPSFRISPVNKG